MTEGNRPGPALALVVAVGRNGVIGRDGDLPWRLPTDLRHFRAVTMGKPIVMGRRTFESIGRPLDGRANIVITRDDAFAPEGVVVENDVDAALAAARRIAHDTGADEVMVVGGGSVYAEVIGRAERLYVTHVDASPEGDTTFPEIDEGLWRPVHEEAPPRSDRDTASVRFVVYERRGPAAD
jgi:dihydrofolate reductase